MLNELKGDCQQVSNQHNRNHYINFNPKFHVYVKLPWIDSSVILQRKSHSVRLMSNEVSFSFLHNKFLHVELFSIAKFWLTSTRWEYPTKKARCHHVKTKYTSNCNESVLEPAGYYLRKVEYWICKFFFRSTQANFKNLTSCFSGTFIWGTQTDQPVWNLFWIQPSKYI